MQTLRNILLAAAATLAMVSSAFADETLKMGIEGAYPPFNNKDASGQVVGFDVEIGNALCAKMKVTCEVVTSDWDGSCPVSISTSYLPTLHRRAMLLNVRRASCRLRV